MALLQRFFDDGIIPGALDGELFVPPFYHRRYCLSPQRTNCERSEASSTEVACTPDKFTVNMDVRHFAPEEITVKTIDNSVVVHGKHEEKSDEHGYIQREFTRRYVLPKDVDPGTVTCSMSRNGVLAVEAPRKKTASGKENIVPIAVEHIAAKDSKPAAVEERPNQNS